MFKKLAVVFTSVLAGHGVFSCDPAGVCERLSPYMDVCGYYAPSEICTLISDFCAGL